MAAFIPPRHPAQGDTVLHLVSFDIGRIPLQLPAQTPPSSSFELQLKPPPMTATLQAAPPDIIRGNSETRLSTARESTARADKSSDVEQVATDAKVGDIPPNGGYGRVCVACVFCINA